MPASRLQVDLLRRLLRTGSTARAAHFVERLRAADLADVYAALEPPDRKLMLEAVLSSERVADALAELPADVRTEVLAELDDARVQAILERLPPDDAAQLLTSFAEDRRDGILARLEPRRRGELEILLLYPAGSAARRMTTRVLALPKTATAEEAIEAIRKHSDVEAIFYLYVLDEEGRLTAVVPIRRLVAAPASRTLGELGVGEPIAVRALADQEEAAQLVARHNLLALPVVDEQRRLLGVITVDDVIDVLEEEATQDIYRMAGLSEADRVFTPFTRSVGKRLPWMLVNLLTAFLAAGVVALFTDTIARFAVLAALMPVVAGMGGIGGTQALTIITRGIALGEIEFSTQWRAIAKEVGVGVTIGATTGLICAAGAWLWQGNPWLGGILFIAMTANLAIAGLAGAAIPLLLKALGQDPALGSGVLVTTFTDVCGFGMFLGLATLAIAYL